MNYIIIKTTLMILVLILSSIADIKTTKIPNIITLPFLFIATIITCIYNRGTLIENIIAIIGLYFLSVIGVMGMGDIKLVMGLTMLVGVKTTLYGVLLSCIALAVYSFSKDTETTTKEIKLALKSLTQMDISSIAMSQHKIVFAPFLSIGYSLVYILTTIIPALGVR